MKEKIDVSIVIVCMNNIKNLFPCLNSIIKNTSKQHETFVVAYLFTKENLNKLRKEYSWVTVIESNEIRGFSENNNLALRQIKGEFCFVLNDDTFFDSPVIDNLVDSFDKRNISIISPNILFPNGDAQCCGRPPMSWYHYVFKLFRLWDETKPSKYINQKGMFQSYNVLGAGFMIRTSIFEQLGWFDERYFFCPEDIALSTDANKKGYNVYVNSNIELFHIGGGSRWSKISEATKPASMKGSLIFHSNDSMFKWVIISISQLLSSFINYLYCTLRSLNGDKESKIKSHVCLNMFLSVFSKDSPKELFIKYYNKIK